MKKLVIIISLSIASLSVQACLINLENDLDTPVTIRTKQGEVTTVAPHGALTFGNSNQKAVFILNKEHKDYTLKQTTCSETHLINIKASHVGTYSIPHFYVEKTDNPITNSNANNSCGCNH